MTQEQLSKGNDIEAELTSLSIQRKGLIKILNADKKHISAFEPCNKEMLIDFFLDADQVINMALKGIDKRISALKTQFKNL